MKRRFFLNVVFFSLLIICFIPGVYSQTNKSIQMLPLGTSLLIPIGRSSLETNGIEILLNDRIVPYEKIYDGYGGYWARISCNELSKYSIMTVRYTLQKENVSTYRHGNETAAAWITPSRFIDSEDSAIREQAHQIFDGTKTVEENVRAISDFVIGHLKFDQKFHRAPASISASQTLFQRKGVCINFSRLFIALCRANGIPARSISGVVLNQEHQDQYDFHHEWVEFMDEEGVWHPLDLTYTQAMNFSDIRYTDLVYAAEDHPYFSESTNENLTAGRPLALENKDIVLFHFHPIFPGAKYGFILIEDHRPDFFVIEKTINLIKRGKYIIISQFSDSSIEQGESLELMEELVFVQNQIESPSGEEYSDEFVQQLPEWLKYYSGKEFQYEQRVFNTVKLKFEIDSQKNEIFLTVYNSENIPTILKPGLMGNYYINKNERNLLIAAKAFFDNNTIIWNTVIPTLGWAAKYIYRFSDDMLEVNVVDINGNHYSAQGLLIQ